MRRHCTGFEPFRLAVPWGRGIIFAPTKTRCERGLKATQSYPQKEKARVNRIRILQYSALITEIGPELRSEPAVEAKELRGVALIRKVSKLSFIIINIHVKYILDCKTLCRYISHGWLTNTKGLTTVFALWRNPTRRRILERRACRGEPLEPERPSRFVFRCQRSLTLASPRSRPSGRATAKDASSYPCESGVMTTLIMSPSARARWDFER